MSRRRERFARQLRAVQIFAGLPPEQLDAIADRAAHAREPAGMTLAREGERGDELVLVLAGEVEVSRAGAHLATLGPGEVVGEMALFDPDARRHATVVARTAADVAYLGRHDVEWLAVEAPDVLAALRALAAQRADARPVRVPSPHGRPAS